MLNWRTPLMEAKLALKLAHLKVNSLLFNNVIEKLPMFFNVTKSNASTVNIKCSLMLNISSNIHIF